MTRLRQTLIVFVRAPQIGAVKTRLARAIGAAEAWRFYRHTTRHVLKRIVDRRWSTVLAVTPPGFAKRGRFWPSRLPRRAQKRGDLGDRMAEPPGRLGGSVVIVGSDIPEIERRHVERAFAALRRSDLVFGPAEDGGFWLIGFGRRWCRAATARRSFRGVRWSSATALADTLRNTKGARVAFVDRLADVDTGADWRRWRERRC
jgi:rSAM/selenodomain-associated transferase 1